MRDEHRATLALLNARDFPRNNCDVIEYWTIGLTEILILLFSQWVWVMVPVLFLKWMLNNPDTSTRAITNIY